MKMFPGEIGLSCCIRVGSIRATQNLTKRAFCVCLTDVKGPVAINTTNPIESANGMIRKFTRHHKKYPNAESSLKLIYLSIREAWKFVGMEEPCCVTKIVYSAAKRQARNSFCHHTMRNAG